MARGRPYPGSISVKVVAAWYLRWILSTHSRSSLNMNGFEPSIDLDFENVFLKGCQLNNFFFGTFLPSSMRSWDTVEMQGYELAATLAATSGFLNLFWGHRRAPRDHPVKGKRSVCAPSLCARLAEQDPCIFRKGLCLTEASCTCLLYTSPSPRDRSLSRMPSSA